jgi:hypothetical protein
MQCSQTFILHAPLPCRSLGRHRGDTAPPPTAPSACSASRRCRRPLPRWRRAQPPKVDWGGGRRRSAPWLLGRWWRLICVQRPGRRPWSGWWRRLSSGGALTGGEDLGQIGWRWGKLQILIWVIPVLPIRSSSLHGWAGLVGVDPAWSLPFSWLPHGVGRVRRPRRSRLPAGGGEGACRSA